MTGDDGAEERTSSSYRSLNVRYWYGIVADLVDWYEIGCGLWGEAVRMIDL